MLFIREPFVKHSLIIQVHPAFIPIISGWNMSFVISYLYADDAKIYKVICQTSEQADLQAVVNTVKNWSDEWLLRLNIDKCKMVSYYFEKSDLY